METNKSNPSLLKVGDKLSETQYYTITNIVENLVEVKNDRGFTFSIEKPIIGEGMYTADQYTQQVLLSRTELVQRLSEVGDTIITVCFNKQPAAKDIKEALATINKGKILPNAEIAKVVDKAYEGAERIMVCHVLSTETAFGRSKVIDLEQPIPERGAPETRYRLVDHRTLKWAIIKGTKYVVQ